MQIPIGRLIDHVHLTTDHFDDSRRFYRAVLGVLGREIQDAPEGAFWCDALDVGTPEAVTRGKTHVHLAFQAGERATVDRFQAEGLVPGGTDFGTSGERDDHPGDDDAFLLDPDGNNVEAGFHGPAERSADAVTIAFPH